MRKSLPIDFIRVKELKNDFSKHYIKADDIYQLSVIGNGAFGKVLLTAEGDMDEYDRY